MAKLSLTPGKIVALRKAIAEHGLVEYSARRAGIAPRTLREWRERGRADARENRGGIFVELNEAIENGREDFKARALGEIRKAGHKSWQAWAWTLERMFPDEFALGGLRSAAEQAGERKTLRPVIFLDGRDPAQRAACDAIRASNRN